MRRRSLTKNDSVVTIASSSAPVGDDGAAADSLSDSADNAKPLRAKRGSQKAEAMLNRGLQRSAGGPSDPDNHPTAPTKAMKTMKRTPKKPAVNCDPDAIPLPTVLYQRLKGSREKPKEAETNGILNHVNKRSPPHPHTPLPKDR